jgi:hypothetical protein
MDGARKRIQFLSFFIISSFFLFRTAFEASRKKNGANRVDTTDPLTERH